MLTEMVVDNYIPNDTHMTADESRVQVRADLVCHHCKASCSIPGVTCHNHSASYRFGCAN